MSDFDKEAEREKLRKKYEDDADRRESTEQMSELLLQGATMTNAHCSDCGDPIFRYDGQEFCPTCQKPVDRGTDHGNGDDTDGAPANQTDNAQSGDHIEVTEPSNDATVQFGSGDGERDASESGRQPPTDQTAASAGEPATDESVKQVPSATPSNRPTTDDTASAHLSRAQQLLAQTVEDHARQAAEADSPHKAREHLETAREAAETLDAIEF